MLLQILLIVLVALSLFSCIPLSKKENLISQIKYLINNPALAKSQICIYIASITHHIKLFKQNEYKLFVPAHD